MPSSRITANDCAANASFNSMRSISLNLSPVCFNTFGIASTGPIPINSGATPATENPTYLAIGVSPSSFTFSPLITITPAAASFIWDELPAVTDPPALNTALNFAKTSLLVSALGPSSFRKVNFSLMISPSALIFFSTTSIGVIWESNFPFSQAEIAL